MNKNNSSLRTKFYPEFCILFNLNPAANKKDDYIMIDRP